MKKRIFILYICCVICLSTAKAQDGTLDSSFGVNGIVTTTVNQYASHGYSVAVHPYEKILLAGSYKSTNNLDMLVIRYHKNGGIDSTFGTDGKLALDFYGQDDEAKVIKIQVDGKILLAGYATVGTKKYFALTRFNTNFTIDSNFGNNGKVITSSLYNAVAAISSLAIQSDEKILAFGTTTDSNYYSLFSLVRYNVNGSIDSTFGINGKVENFAGVGKAIALQSDGKVIAVGTSDSGSTTVRYNINGTLDNTFGFNGIVYLRNRANAWYYTSDVQIQSDGKILVSGSEIYGTVPSFGFMYRITRYNSDGILDTTFNKIGYIANSNNPSWGVSSGGVQHLIVTSDGKIIIGGNLGLNLYLSLSRYFLNGKIDTSFGKKGNTKYWYKTGSYIKNNVYSIVLQNDSNIIVAGSDSNFFLTRFHSSYSTYVDFIASATVGLITDSSSTQFAFTDKSNRNPTAWGWSFSPNNVIYQNNTSDSSQNPIVKFTKGGNYTVTLTATYPSGNLTATKTNYIWVTVKPVADFYFNPAIYNINTVFKFYDGSIKIPTSWNWSFTPSTPIYQNGTNMNSQNPNVRFPAYGVYSVKLKVSNAAGEDSIMKTNCISLSGLPVEDIYSNSNEIRIYPNPANEYIYIHSNNLIIKTIVIKDISGKQIEIIKTVSEIDIRNYSNGFYILEMETDKGILLKKLIINR